MANDQLKTLISQGLAALKAGSQIAAHAAADLQGDVRNPQLKTALEQGSAQAKQWTARIDRAYQEAGGTGEQQNPILEAHYEVGKKIRQQATDANSRDLGIIAAGQLATHYWIASFGTLSAYAQQAGMSQAVLQDLQTCLAEAKQGDEEQTKIAQQILTSA